MNHHTLGKSPLQVSRLCLGTMMFGDQTDITQAKRIVDHAHAHGVNFIDTADVYTLGASESMVGELIASTRDDWVLATKLGNSMQRQAPGEPAASKPNVAGYSRAWMLRECEASLKRLRTDRIDLYYLHRDYNGMDLEEPLRGVDQLLRDGKIRYWGLSNFRGWRIGEAVHVARALNMPAPVVCQPYYNLLNRMPEVEVLEACAFHGLGVVPYSPIARGVLTGKYLPDAAPPEDSRGARKDKRMMQTEFRAESFAIAQTLAAHCRGKGVSLAHFATAWVLANRHISAVIAGPRTFEQWQDYFGALDVTITPEDEALVDSLVKPGHPSTPGYSDPLYPLTGR
jgi:aryl-alcohol dehydrogenase-like predicted oxidoreductase